MEELTPDSQVSARAALGAIRMSDTYVVDGLVEFIGARDHVSWVELVQQMERLGVDTEGDGTVELTDCPNLCLWLGLSDRAIEIVASGYFRARVELHPSDSLVYLMDGGIPNLPIAKKPPKNGYSTLHWAPTVMRLRQGVSARKEQGMASAFEATVQLYKNDHGVSIVTDATTVESFEQALAKVIAEDWTEYDAGLLVPQVREILNKLQNYKSQVIERRLLIAGQTMPSPVDLRFTTGPGLPSVELAPSNGETATV